LVPSLYGEQNAHLRRIEKAMNVTLSSRGNEIAITDGSESAIKKTKQILEALWHKLQLGEAVDTHTIDSALRFLEEKNNPSKNGTVANNGFSEDALWIATKKKPKITPRTPMQAAYIQCMKDNKLAFGVGPAGTGKTYLAVAKAVELLEQGVIERIVLTRPAVEAGERIGFLPGEMKEKMDPYMRPLYDALQDTMAPEKLQKLMATEEIEIAPLAFMRGRTLSNAFIILDEGQNTTHNQMKMFLTRIGENSHAVVTGDPSQTDLPAHEKSGLTEALNILNDVEDIGIVYFTHKDVVRSGLVTKIVKAYDDHDKHSR
jgi:phosphate starvation-inducible PhoH-like protein